MCSWTAELCSPGVLNSNNSLDCALAQSSEHWTASLAVQDQIGLHTCAVQIAHWSATIAVQGNMDCKYAQSRWTTGLQRSAVQVYLTLSTAWPAQSSEHWTAALAVQDQIGLHTCAVQMAHWSATLAVQGNMDCKYAQSRWTTGLQRSAVQP